MYEILCGVYEMKSCVATTITITMTKTGSGAAVQCLVLRVQCKRLDVDDDITPIRSTDVPLVPLKEGQCNAAGEC